MYKGFLIKHYTHTFYCCQELTSYDREYRWFASCSFPKLQTLPTLKFKVIAKLQLWQQYHKIYSTTSSIVRPTYIFAPLLHCQLQGLFSKWVDSLLSAKTRRHNKITIAFTNLHQTWPKRYKVEICSYKVRQSGLTQSSS